MALIINSHGGGHTYIAISRTRSISRNQAYVAAGTHLYGLKNTNM